MEIAAYTAGEADRFRRAMSRHRSRVEMEELRDGFIRRCIEHDLSEEVAQQIFKSVAGFAEFGFCKSHAAAFARTAYETAWLRMTYPAHYTCALLNAQPMGFYHPSVLVDDAKRHGVKVLPVDVTRSRARCLVEATGPADFGIRLGFAYVRGLGPTARAACDDAVVAGANTSVAAFWRHTLLPRVAMENLIRVGAFDAVAAGQVAPPAALDAEGDRGVAAAAKTPAEQPSRRPSRRSIAAAVVTGPPRGSGAVAGNRLGDAPHTPHDPSSDPAPPLVSLPAPPPILPEMDERTRVNTEYAITEVSTGPHLVSFMRERLNALGCVPLAKVRDMVDGTRIRVAGLVITRQQPSTARGFRFFTLADEDAHLDLVFRPAVVQRTLEVSRHPLLMVDGRLQVELGQGQRGRREGDRAHAGRRPDRPPGTGPREPDSADRTTTADRNCHRHTPWTRRDTSVTLRQQCPDITCAARDTRHRLSHLDCYAARRAGWEDMTEHTQEGGGTPLSFKKVADPAHFERAPMAKQPSLDAGDPNLAFEAAPRVPLPRPATPDPRTLRHRHHVAHCDHPAAPPPGSRPRRDPGVRGGPGLTRCRPAAALDAHHRHPPRTARAGRSGEPGGNGWNIRGRDETARAEPREGRGGLDAAWGTRTPSECGPRPLRLGRARGSPQTQALRQRRARHRAHRDPRRDPRVRRLRVVHRPRASRITPSPPRPPSARSPPSTRPRQRP